MVCQHDIVDILLNVVFFMHVICISKGVDLYLFHYHLLNQSVFRMSKVYILG